MRRPLFLSVLFLLFAEGLLDVQDLSPDKKKFYQDVTSGKGLYSEQEDKIVVLTVDNFKRRVYNATHPRSWFVEFYNSWCGHCHRFAPVWKEFPLDIYGWKNVVEIGAIDCSNDNNTPLCRDYDILYYPQLKYFPPLSPPEFIGRQVGRVEPNVDSLRHTLIDNVREDAKNESKVLVNIEPYVDSFRQIWHNVPDAILYNVLVLEETTSYMGADLAFDLNEVKAVVRLVDSSNVDVLDKLPHHGLPSFFVIDRNNYIEHVNLINYSRLAVYEGVQKVLRKGGVRVPDMVTWAKPNAEPIDINHLLQVSKMKSSLRQKLNLHQIYDIVFQVDLESTLKHSLYVEISSKKVIQGEVFDGLKQFLQILSKYFPFARKGQKFLQDLSKEIESMPQVSGSDFNRIARDLERKHSPVFLTERTSEWLGCRGSSPLFRGFPCGLWTLFHTLTVFENSPEPREVLRGITAYVKHFFGCSHCSKHFQEMAVTMEGNVSSHDDSVLWLWKAHNKVNARLHLDPTEDPHHPKIQFPNPEMCSDCWKEGQTWDTPGVLNFLHGMYKNISYILPEELVLEDNALKTKAPPSSAPLNKSIDVLIVWLTALLTSLVGRRSVRA